MQSYRQILLICVSVLVSGCATPVKFGTDIGETKISFHFYQEDPVVAFRTMEDKARSVSGANLHVLFLAPYYPADTLDVFEVPLLTFDAKVITLSEALQIAAESIGARVVRSGDDFAIVVERDPNKDLQDPIHDTMIPHSWPNIDWPPIYNGPIVVHGTCRNSVTEETLNSCSVESEFETFTVSGGGKFQSVIMVPWSRPTLAIGAERICLPPTPYTNTCHLQISAPGFLTSEVLVHIVSSNLLYLLDCKLVPVGDE